MTLELGDVSQIDRCRDRSARKVRRAFGCETFPRSPHVEIGVLGIDSYRKCQVSGSTAPLPPPLPPHLDAESLASHPRRGIMCVRGTVPASSTDVLRGQVWRVRTGSAGRGSGQRGQRATLCGRPRGHGRAWDASRTSRMTRLTSRDSRIVGSSGGSLGSRIGWHLASTSSTEGVTQWLAA